MAGRFIGAAIGGGFRRALLPGLLTLLPCLALAASPTALSLNCTPIPSQTAAHSGQLCVGITPSPTGPYDDVVIYHQTKETALVLLGSYRNGVSTFGGFGFTAGGRLMWESWAEEGHSSYSFYETAHYLSAGQDAKAIDHLDGYSVEQIHQFTDDGKLVYAASVRDDEPCPKTKGQFSSEPASVMDAQGNIQYCLQYLFVKAGK